MKLFILATLALMNHAATTETVQVKCHGLSVSTSGCSYA